jgi:hypothetical protein
VAGTWYDSSTMALALASGQTTHAASTASAIAACVPDLGWPRGGGGEGGFPCPSRMRGPWSAGRRRIDTQILPSGQMPLETARSNGIHYSCYNLEVGQRGESTPRLVDRH